MKQRTVKNWVLWHLGFGIPWLGLVWVLGYLNVAELPDVLVVVAGVLVIVGINLWKYP